MKRLSQRIKIKKLSKRVRSDDWFVVEEAPTEKKQREFLEREMLRKRKQRKPRGYGDPLDESEEYDEWLETLVE